MCAGGLEEFLAEISQLMMVFVLFCCAPEGIRKILVVSKHQIIKYRAILMLAKV